ncbi:hypothetical protein ZHAS_00005852 [Anopheles sinensis]|uniref:Uncharacterized protein n=1 Tax=Anopheles sinensis TaxID=74873 RepID=A0A084VKG0_ANOSI|nr:hypothetical protein ZHAS_00005852 [Anopheles sinensis]
MWPPSVVCIPSVCKQTGPCFSGGHISRFAPVAKLGHAEPSLPLAVAGHFSASRAIPVSIASIMYGHGASWAAVSASG